MCRPETVDCDTGQWHMVTKKVNGWSQYKRTTIQSRQFQPAMYWLNLFTLIIQDIFFPITIVRISKFSRHLSNDILEF